MSGIEPTLRQVKPAPGREPPAAAPPPIRDLGRPHRRLVPLLVTLTAIAIAVALSWAMWNAYMATPWTRDGTVRAYVVTMAPEVAGRIVQLPVVDNQFLHKGDLLMVIDPTNYRIAVDLAQAAVQQAQANVQNIEAQIAVQQAEVVAKQAQVEETQAALRFAKQQADRYQDLAQKGWSPVQSEQQYISQLQQQEAALKNAQAALALAERQIDSLKAQRASAEAQLGESKARVNLERAEIRSPVNGWVTNLLAQLGDYANVGQNQITLVDADSFWIDAYFTETSLGSIQEGDPANVKLMGYSEIVRGHIGSIARGINVVNAQAGPQGLATVNPIFTWVRLAQRIPVRIHIDHVPDGLTLVAGSTATVEVEPRARPPLARSRAHSCRTRTIAPPIIRRAMERFRKQGRDVTQSHS